MTRAEKRRNTKRKDSLHEQALKQFARAKAAEQRNREAALEDIRFENGEQWSEAEKKEREGRPTPVINKTAGIMKQILGDIRRANFAIKVHPVDSGSDPQTAKVIEGLVRNIEGVSEADIAYETAAYQAAAGGFGYFRVLTRYADETAWEQDIHIAKIANQFSVYLDPDAESPLEAKFCFIADTIPKEDFEARYPEAVGEWESGTGESMEGWFGEDDARIAEYFYKKPVNREIALLADGRTIDLEGVQVFDGGEVDPQFAGQQFAVMEEPVPVVKRRTVKSHQVMWAKISGKEILEEQEWPGKYIPVVPIYGEEINIEGERIFRSAIRHAKEPQRLYNWMSAKYLETIAQAPLAPFIAEDKAIEPYQKFWEQANKKPLPYLPYKSGFPAPSRQPSSIPDTGALQGMVQAADDIKATTGIYDASMGAQGNETSGKAILARQAEGDQATFAFLDNYARAVRTCGKILVDLIPRIYDTPRIVRTLGEDGKQEMVRINQEIITERGERLIHDLTAGKYDVVIDSGPSYATSRMETAENMLRFVQALPQAGPLMGDLIARNLDWEGADELHQRLQSLLPPQATGQEAPPDPNQVKLGLDIEGKQLDNARKQAQLQQMGPEQMQQLIPMIQQVTMQTIQQMMGGSHPA